MTQRAARFSGFAALAVAAALVLTGCDLGHPGGFTARSNSYCGDAATAISKLSRPSTPKEQLQYATDRYAVVERLVSEMTESGDPPADESARLRTDWLQPARASLVQGRDVLAELRTAVNDRDATAATAAYARSLATGTQGVDTALLRTDGLSRCATVFAPTPV